jgi:hypothetical protein
MWILEFEDGELLSQDENNKREYKIDPNNPPKVTRCIYYSDKENPMMVCRIPKDCKPHYRIQRICTETGKILNSIIKIGWQKDETKILICYDIKRKVIFQDIE